MQEFPYALRRFRSFRGRRSSILNPCLFAMLALSAFVTHSARAQGRDTLVDVGGYRLHFRVLPGQGVPILFDAGGGDDGTVWDSLLAPVAGITGAPLITYDRAGFGKSEIDSRTRDIESHGILNGVEGLETGLSALGYGGSIVLVAHSYGALYATLYASRNPTLVKAAVLVDGSTACWFTDGALRAFADQWRNTDTLQVKAENLGTYYQFHNLPRTVALMRTVTFPSSIPVIDLVSEYPPFSDSGDVARWKDCHKQFVAAAPNRDGIATYGTTHYIFNDNPPLVVQAITKAYARAVGEPEASAIAERDQTYAIAAANDMMRRVPVYQRSETILSSWGHTLLERVEKSTAIDLFKLNTELHPHSWHAFDSLAESYEAAGRTTLAIKSYERSLALNPGNGNAADHLKKLRRINAPK